MPDLDLIKQGEQGVVRGVFRPVRCVCYIIPDTSRISPAWRTASGRQSGYPHLSNFPIRSGCVRSSNGQPAAPFAI